jgi:uncharacterized protein involved in outer membrane biogenesis
MKKWILRIGIAGVVLLILVVVAIGFFLDAAIKTGIETFGPKITQVEIKLESVGLSLLSGGGKIKGLVVGNPTGYKTPSAIQVGSASLSLQPSSLLGDKVRVRSINVQNPEITFETDLRSNNLKKILNNIETATGGSGTAAKPAPDKTQEAKAGRKLQVDEFIISGGKLHVSVTTLGGQSATLTLPDIQLKDLGTGPDGITGAELTKLALSAIEKSAAELAAKAVTDLGKGATGLTKDANKAANSAVTKGIDNLFKKQ